MAPAPRCYSCLVNLITQGNAERTHLELLSAEKFLNNLGERAGNRIITPRGGVLLTMNKFMASGDFRKSNTMTWSPAPQGRAIRSAHNGVLCFGPGAEGGQKEFKSLTKGQWEAVPSLWPDRVRMWLLESGGTHGS